MRRFFCLQLCDSNTNNTHKIKFNTGSDYSIERVSRTDAFNPNSQHVKITMTLICHDLKDIDENKTTAGIHHSVFLKFSFLEKQQVPRVQIEVSSDYIAVFYILQHTYLDSH